MEFIFYLIKQYLHRTKLNIKLVKMTYLTPKRKRLWAHPTYFQYIINACIEQQLKATNFWSYSSYFRFRYIVWTRLGRITIYANLQSHPVVIFYIKIWDKFFNNFRRSSSRSVAITYSANLSWFVFHSCNYRRKLHTLHSFL